MADQQILFVCTANICRSPAAEAIARDRFGEQRFEFGSAGFLENGRQFEPNMAKAVERLGVQVSGHHQSRVLDPEIIADADLVLTMESRHVQNIVIDDQPAFDKTMPLKQAVEQLRSGGPTTIEGLLDRLADRDPMQYLDSRWDVEDPYKRARRHYRKSAAEIDELVGTLLRGLGA